MSDVLDGSRPLRRREGLEEAPLQGEMMLFDAASGKFFVLNTTMAYVWNNINGERSSDELRAGLCEAFAGTDPAVVREDLGKGLAELLELGLVTMAEGRTA